MTQRKREIGDPLEQAASLGTIGEKKKDAQTSSIPDAQASSSPGTQAYNSSDVQTSKTGRRKQTVYLPPYLVKWIKIHAAEREKKISEIVEEALEAYKATHQ